MLLNQLSRALYEIRSTQKTNIYITLGYFHTDKSRIVLNSDGAVITTMFPTQYRYIWTLIQVCFVDQQRADPLVDQLFVGLRNRPVLKSICNDIE